MPARAVTHGLVSVVVPSWNKADFIATTLDSVLAQEGVGVEVIVVDDHSTDATMRRLEPYRDRVRIHRQPENRGAAAARNLGADLATGDHLLFLDADDMILPGTLAALVRALDGRTDRFAACPWQRMRLERGRWVAYSPDKPLDPPGSDPVIAWLGNWYIPPCAILWPRPLFEGSGGWDGEVSAADDEELMIRMLLRGTPIARATEGEARYRFFKEGGTLSTTPSRSLAVSRLRGVEKIEREAARQDVLSRYRHAIGRKSMRLARSYLAPFPDLALVALSGADRLLDHRRLDGPLAHRLSARVLGLERKERLARWAQRRGWIRREGAAPPESSPKGGASAGSSPGLSA